MKPLLGMPMIMVTKICVIDYTLHVFISLYILLYKMYNFLDQHVLDPIPMAAVVGVTLSILIIFLALVIGLLIAYKKEKMCFKSKFYIQQVSKTWGLRLVIIL